MLKLAGILFVVAASYLVGKVYSGECYGEIAYLMSLAEFLKHLKARVSGYLEPISEIALGYEKEVTDGVLLSELSSGVRLDIALLDCVDKLPLDKVKKEEIGTLVRSLDLSSAEGLVRELDRLITLIDGVLKERGEMASGRTRAVRIASISIGLGVCILLL